MGTPAELFNQNIKEVPDSAETRLQIRVLAATKVDSLDPDLAPDLGNLRAVGESLLSELELPIRYLGYTILQISNAYWIERYMSVPTDRRLLLLPICLSDRDVCRGGIDSVGLHCAHCGACDISELKRDAEFLGYQVIVAEGTSSVLTKLLEGSADAVLGVACLDSLEKSHSRISQIGIPHVAVPLLTDGCINTTAELSEVYRLLHVAKKESSRSYRSYLPLLRHSYGIFKGEHLRQILTSSSVKRECWQEEYLVNPLQSTECIALNCLISGGKRLRPFITLAAYCVGKYGQGAAASETDPSQYIPQHIESLAVAIETLHKASLVHDDIEDQEEFRYGRKTVQAEYGVPVAINVGDYLVGLGYNIIISLEQNLGSQKTADILSVISKAHLNLCRGQGAEIMWKELRGESLTSMDALSVYALKTAPAFKAALATGLLAAGVDAEQDYLSRYCVYLGEAYQIENDLDDWTSDDLNHIIAGGDLLAGRPTIIWAFLSELRELQRLKNIIAGLEPVSQVTAAAEFLNKLGIFSKTRSLRDKLRKKAMQTAERFSDPNISSLLTSLVKIILPQKIN